MARSLGTEQLLAMARSMTIPELRDAMSGGILDLNAAVEQPGEMVLCGDYEWSLIDVLNTKELEAERLGQLAPA
ncbi:hypothetical protein GC173_11495 [bacterium]|nr:hypothetical protein [bacterium]